MWSSLSPVWQAILEELWAAYSAGSLPIGAVITDGSGGIVARGRNHRLDVDSNQDRITNHRLGHAELNALLKIDGKPADLNSWRLYTSLEPCPMCMGAIYMSGIHQVHFAARDPYSGSTNLLGSTPYLSRKKINVYPPENADLEMLCSALHAEALLRDPFVQPDHAFFQELARAMPHTMQCAQYLVATRVLDQFRTIGWSVGMIMDRLVDILRERCKFR